MTASRRRRGGVAAGLVVALASLVPATAGAAQSPVLSFALHAGGGYQVSVTGFRQTVGVSVSRMRPARHSGAVTTYISRGQLGARSMRADLGPLGRLSMRFEPSGKVVYGDQSPGCRGADRSVERFGRFVGSFNFRGEGGYVHVRAHRAKGTARTPALLRCVAFRAIPASQIGTGRPTGHVELTRLDAGFRHGLQAVSFLSDSNETSRAHFYATSEEGTKGKVAIYREAFAQAPARAFATDRALSFATLKPPPPFSGTGSLTRKPSGARVWGGSLAVSFLGAPNVPLTGSLFKTELVRSW